MFSCDVIAMTNDKWMTHQSDLVYGLVQAWDSDILYSCD